MLGADEKPDISYSDIGGLDTQKQEVREAVELPLTHFELYKQIGIDPPRGVLMYGPPGCGKTMLAKVKISLASLISKYFQGCGASYNCQFHPSCRFRIRSKISR